jgi:hypothetical protein
MQSGRFSEIEFDYAELSAYRAFSNEVSDAFVHITSGVKYNLV